MKDRNMDVSGRCLSSVCVHVHSKVSFLMESITLYVIESKEYTRPLSVLEKSNHKQKRSLTQCL